jgi:glycine C-acetyltransferase
MSERHRLLNDLDAQLQELKKEGLFKEERVIRSPQEASITLQNGAEVINLCSNNYLGLDNHPHVVNAAQQGLKDFGFGLSSVRFICGTQTVHKQLELRLSRFLETEDTILYPSCFDANGGLFETLLGPEDAVISDQLNHASIIDGIRLCKAQRFRYANNDMQDLEAKLQATQDCRYRLIATDGVFSMDGYVARLDEVCDLAEKYNALVMVDDCHGVGFMGEKGRGSIEACGVLGRVDVITGTLGKALGGASGGYTSGRKEIIGWLRQRSRPYLFSNTLAPCIAAASIAVLDLMESTADLRENLKANTAYFRQAIQELGLRILPGDHPIVPVMLEDAALAQTFAERLLDEGVYVVGFSYPVVPKGKARIRTQMSAAHTREDLERAVEAFKKVAVELGVV